MNFCGFGFKGSQKRVKRVTEKGHRKGSQKRVTEKGHRKGSQKGSKGSQKRVREQCIS
jgi:hypothetical protein